MHASREVNSLAVGVLLVTKNQEWFVLLICLTLVFYCTLMYISLPRHITARIEGVSVWQSDNYTGPSPNKIERNVPQSNTAWPNNSTVVTVTVFGNLYEGKNTAAVHGEVSVLLPVLPTLRHIPAPPQKRVCHQQKTSTHRVSPSDGQPSRPRLQWTFPPKQPPSPRVTESDSVQFSDGGYIIMSFRVKKHNWHFPGCLVGQDLHHYTSIWL